MMHLAATLVLVVTAACTDRRAAEADAQAARERLEAEFGRRDPGSPASGEAPPRVASDSTTSGSPTSDPSGGTVSGRTASGTTSTGATSGATTSDPSGGTVSGRTAPDGTMSTGPTSGAVTSSPSGGTVSGRTASDGATSTGTTSGATTSSPSDGTVSGSTKSTGPAADRVTDGRTAGSAESAGGRSSARDESSAAAAGASETAKRTDREAGAARAGEWSAAGDAPRRSATQEGPATGQEVDDLLARADAAYRGLERLRALFHQRIENRLLGRTREGRGTWRQAGRNRFRMDFDDPPDDIYVADGVCLWLYEPSLHQQVMVSRLEDGAEVGTIDILGRLLAEARTRYVAADAGAEEVGGVPTRVVSLTPRDPDARFVEVRLWIGMPDRHVRRFRLREENETIRTVTLTELEPQAPIDAAVFEFVPPQGVPVFPLDTRCAG